MKEPFLNDQKRDFGWPMLAVTLALVVVGVLFIFSASGEASQELPLYRQKFFQQIVWCVVGAAAAAALCLVDYGKVARWAVVGYWLTIVPLVVILVIGTAHHGSRRWINLAGFSLQPSELAKISFIFLMADYLSRPVEELRQPKVFFAALGYTALPFALIYKEPDFGSALAFLSISLAMMFTAGVPNRFLGTLAALFGTLAVVMVVAILWKPEKVTMVKSFQKDRLRSYFGLMKKNDPADYEVKQSLISVGSGGLLGKGWRQGSQHELGYLPSDGASNDFIFAVIAEEVGFVGSVVILALYTVLLFSGIKVASQARDRLGQLLAVGVVTLLFSHVFINIGMNIRIMPVAGIPLPLISYGGSSVVCSLIAIGILHNVHIYRRAY